MNIVNSVNGFFLSNPFYRGMFELFILIKQAHEHSEKIEKIVTTGVYAKIRHPLYLSLILQNLGIGFAFGIMITFVLALLTIIHWIVTALKEEAILLQSFPNEYMHYKQEVRWRMIPGVF